MLTLPARTTYHRCVQVGANWTCLSPTAVYDRRQDENRNKTHETYLDAGVLVVFREPRTFSTPKHQLIRAP